VSASREQAQLRTGRVYSRTTAPSDEYRTTRELQYPSATKKSPLLENATCRNVQGALSHNKGGRLL